jgi:hypothetical protein
MSGIRRFRASLAAVVMVAYLAGCYRYTARGAVAPEELVASEHPGDVRVTLTDGSRHDLTEPSVTADSLLAKRNGRSWSAPLAQVRQLEVRELRVALTVIGVTAAVGISALATAGIVVLLDAGARGSASWVACQLDYWCR